MNDHRLARILWQAFKMIVAMLDKEYGFTKSKAEKVEGFYSVDGRVAGNN